VLATRVGNLLNSSDIARTVKIPLTTLKRYIALLEATFIIKFIYPWHSNLRQRMVKSPKLFFCDTGLVCYLLGLSDRSSPQASMFMGAIFENFVAMELIKQITWSQTKPEIYHYRTQEQKEIDFILETRTGEIVAIEVKSTASPTPDDFRNLKKLQEELPSRVKKCILLYNGNKTLPITNKIWCYPINSLFN